MTPKQSVKFNLKIFSIDKLYYEFRSKNNDEIVKIIIENHKKNIFANETDISIVKPLSESYIIGNFNFYSYCYNQPKNQNYWRLFLPEQLVKDKSFEILEFSFVLFIIYNNNIYCAIGGSGINVIKKYIDPYFGINLYQHFAKPSEDIAISVLARGVTGNLSESSNTYNYNQTVNDSLNYTEVPKKIKIRIREDLKRGIFEKYNLNKEFSIMEVGSYFSLRKKIDFEELKELIVDINNIQLDKSNFINLSLFNRIVEESLISSLDDFLKEKIVSDVVSHGSVIKSLINESIVEIVNMNKILKFYECDHYKIKLKKKKKTDDVIISDRSKIYFESTRHIYNNIDDVNDRFAIKSKLLELNIIGIIEDKDSTFGNFYSHINAELDFQNRKYFRIDNQWFLLDNKFLQRILEESINYYEEYKLGKRILNKWTVGIDEDEYNKSHILPNYYVLDKVIKENIELCDILFIDSDDIYFIHVKDNFNTHMRDLSSQVILSAKRLWNDINNNSGSSYFVETINLYNSKNASNILNADEVLSRIKGDKLKVHFVMAFNNNAYGKNNSIEKIRLSNSNIARFSIVQTVREVLNYRKFAINLIDISEL